MITRTFSRWADARAHAWTLAGLGAVGVGGIVRGDNGCFRVALGEYFTVERVGPEAIQEQALADLRSRAAISLGAAAELRELALTLKPDRRAYYAGVAARHERSARRNLARANCCFDARGIHSRAAIASELLGLSQRSAA